MLPTQEAQVETPMGVMADVEYVDPAQPIAVIPVLRAGLAMAESTQTIVPACVTYHVGYVRDEETLVAAPYLNKLPPSFDMDSKIVVMDIMLATGTAFPCCVFYELNSNRGHIVHGFEFAFEHRFQRSLRQGPLPGSVTVTPE